MCAPPLFSRKLNRNCTLSRTLLNIDGLIRLRFCLIVSLRSSMEATEVSYTFSLNWPERKNHKESIQLNDVATLLAPLQI